MTCPDMAFQRIHLFGKQKIFSIIIFKIFLLYCFFLISCENSLIIILEHASKKIFFSFFLSYLDTPRTKNGIPCFSEFLLRYLKTSELSKSTELYNIEDNIWLNYMAHSRICIFMVLSINTLDSFSVSTGSFDRLMK